MALSIIFQLTPTDSIYLRLPDEHGHAASKRYHPTSHFPCPLILGAILSKLLLVLRRRTVFPPQVLNYHPQHFLSINR